MSATAAKAIVPGETREGLGPTSRPAAGRGGRPLLGRFPLGRGWVRDEPLRPFPEDGRPDDEGRPDWPVPRPL
jgi:hypothetical protein